MNVRKTYVAPSLEDLGDLGTFVRASSEQGGANDGVIVKGKFLDFSL